MGITRDVGSDRERASGASVERGPGADGSVEGADEGGAGDLPEETPPGPDGWPLLGSTIQFVRDPWGFYDQLAEYGDVVSYDVGGFPFVTVLHPDHVQRVLVTDSDAYAKTQFGGRGGEFAPDGVLFSEGEQWRAQRSMLQDAFTLDRIQRYGETMGDVAAEHVAAWPDGEAVALDRVYSDLTLDVLARTLFDLDLGERGEAVTRVADALGERADSRNLSTFLPNWVPTRRQRRFDRAMADFEALTDDLIAERRTAPDLEERDDLLSILLAAEGPDGYRHSEEELHDQLLTFLFAGHETTSLALTYTSMLLAEHDDVLARLHEEWGEVLGDDRPGVTDLPALEYTDRVLTEALRLYPPAYVQFRRTRRDVELGGYRVPEDTYLSVPQFRLHQDERFYDEPDRFDPDRWTDEFEDELPDYAYFPFGGGPRHCIGMRFARTELQLVLPTVLRSLDLELLSDPDPELGVSATLQPVSDVRARVRRRE